MANETSRSTGVIISAFILAIGLIIGAYSLGSQTKEIGARSLVTVKGLAEKPVKADSAEWSVWASCRGETYKEALEDMRKQMASLEQFLEQQGFSEAERYKASPTVSPFMVQENIDGNYTEVQKGYIAQQTLVINTKNLAVVQKAAAAALDFIAEGAKINFGQPNFLVSNLEEIKMSLISSATENARMRAQEFTKQGSAKVGAMRSASQGAFYILPDTGDSNVNDYGGVYDKTTINKTARVVVTISFLLK